MWVFPFITAVLAIILVMRTQKRTSYTSGPHQEPNNAKPNDIFNDAMAPNIARDVLGINDEAGRREIIAAHRRLMRHIHPDRGGSAYLASQINQAKEVLIKSAHRQR